MSALPVIEPIVEPAPRTRTAPRTLPRLPEPIIIELPVKRTQRGRVKQTETQKQASTLLGQVVGFMVVAGLAYGACSLIGQVMVEKARRDGIRATARAQAAARDIAQLRADVQDLSSSKSISDWAAANGFIPIESAPKIAGVNQLVAQHL